MDRVFHQKKVSVIIPTYNRANFLPDAIYSVLKQGYENAEIIVVDDGSTDNTRSVVNSIQQKYSNILYFQNERTKGPSGARNTGIIKSCGDYLAFLDSDDSWLDSHLTIGLQVLSEHPEIDVLFGNFAVVDFHTRNHLYNFFAQKKILHTLKSAQLSPNVRFLQDNLFKALIQENFFHLASAIITRSSLASSILLDESIMFAEDRDFAIRLYKEANAKFAYRQVPVFIMHRHDSNLNNTINLNKNEQLIKAHLYLFAKYIRKYNLSNAEKKILTKLLAGRLLKLSTIHRRKRKYQKALSCILKSLKYGISLDHFKQLTKVLVPFA